MEPSLAFMSRPKVCQVITAAFVWMFDGPLRTTRTSAKWDRHDGSRQTKRQINVVTFGNKGLLVRYHPTGDIESAPLADLGEMTPPGSGHCPEGCDRGGRAGRPTGNRRPSGQPEGPARADRQHEGAGLGNRRSRRDRPEIPRALLGVALPITPTGPTSELGLFLMALQGAKTMQLTTVESQ